MSMNAYHQGQNAALAAFKIARYLTDTDRFEDVMRRHMDANPKKEKHRLAEKGRMQGGLTGGILGALTGGVGGHALAEKLPTATGRLLAALAGAGVGGLGGHALGGWLGGNAGEREFNDREELADTLRSLSPEERRRRLEHSENTRRQRQALAVARQHMYNDLLHYYR